MEQIEGLIQKIENLPDPAARASAVALVQALMEFHGAGLERMMEIIGESGEGGYAVFDSFAKDDLVGSLLLLYGLHPLPLETRVTQALDKVRPYLDSHGGNVELLGVDDGVVRLRDKVRPKAGKKAPTAARGSKPPGRAAPKRTRKSKGEKGTC